MNRCNNPPQKIYIMDTESLFPQMDYLWKRSVILKTQAKKCNLFKKVCNVNVNLSVNVSHPKPEQNLKKRKKP